ncbi:MAG: hypothetical protein ACPHRB_07085 [Candidatus Poseidoniaceae archaeon]
MNRTSCTVGIVVVFLLSGILPLTQLSLNAAAQEPADMNDNPILDEFGEVPMDTIVADAGGYILFSHTTNEIEINESEYHVFYFDVNQNMLGSSVVITLDIVDKLFSIEPDLDIYLYDTNDDLAAYSETDGDETEVIVYEFNQVGLWWLTVEAYEGDGDYILYRDVYSNSAPEIVSENLNTDNPMVYDPVLIDACETYDPDGHEFYFNWFVDGESIANIDEDGNTACFYEFEIDSSEPIMVSFEAVDEYGLSSGMQQMTISPSDPGWNVKAIGNSIAVDVDEVIEFTFYDMAPPMQTPIRSDGMPVVLQIGLKYEIAIESDFSVQLDFDEMDSSGDVLEIVSETINHYETKVWFKPSLVFIIQYGTTEYSLDIPMLSNSQLYALQPFFNLENYSSDLYYWADYIEIDATSLEGFYEFISYQEFTLASVDLYPVLEWMVDNLAAVMGQGWVDTATNLLSKLVDISIPLEFNVDITACGINLIQAKPLCDTCSANPIYVNGPNDFANYFQEIEVPHTTDYELKVAMGVLSYFYVEAQPNIDISLDVNGIRIWTVELFEFETLSNQYLSSNPSGSHILVQYKQDSDFDGVPDVNDFMPNDASQQYDSDSDGCGDNKAGTNGDQFPYDSSECSDSDMDGVGDNADVFPNDSTESMDSDNDGVGDNADVFPNDSNESKDSDNDGVGDNTDAFPNDANETKDSDGDGAGDNSDAYPQDPDKTIQERKSDGDDAEGLPGFTTAITLVTLLSSAIYVRSRNEMKK